MRAVSGADRVVRPYEKAKGTRIKVDRAVKKRPVGALFICSCSIAQRSGRGEYGQQRQQRLPALPQAAAQERNGGHSASVLPMARSASSAASSGASQQVTLSQTRLMPASAQSFSQERIHSPSPQP